MYTRRRSSWKRKTQRRPWFLMVLLFLVGVPVGLELLARLLANVTGVSQQLEAEQSERSKMVQAYRLKFLSPTGQSYSELNTSGQLSATRNPLMGYQLLPQQKSQFWAINPQGFRDADPVSPAKQPGEVRIFVLGGSTAFGQLSTNDQATFAHQLEKFLNDQVAGQRTNRTRYQPEILPYLAEDVDKALALPPRIPDRQYRVINAAVPGYASGNELAMLMQRVANYSPDMIILLNSYSDLLLPSNQSAADIPGLDDVLQGKGKKVDAQISDAIKAWFNQMYLVRGFQQYILRSPQPEAAATGTLNLMSVADQSLEQALPADTAERDRRIDRYRAHLLQMARWSSATKKRLFIGVQPEITGRQQMTPEEAAIVAQLGTTYAEKIKSSYSKLTEAANQVAKTSANVQVLNLYDLYAKTPGQVFQSPTTLTDEANKKLAERFYKSIAGVLAIEPKPFGS